MLKSSKLMTSDFTEEYNSILCDPAPQFLQKYLEIPLLFRLSGIGLLCGTDWCGFFNNSFFYSRLDHSYATALIAWRFTHDKAQAIAALLHDVSTPAFSHVVDFMEGDPATQTKTESLNPRFIGRSAELAALLERDGVSLSSVQDSKMYPVVDNEIPRICADRLAYMYPSAAGLQRLWTLDEIRANYNAIKLLKNEDGQDEPGFDDEKQALLYTERFLTIGRFLLQAEDKAAMQLLADVVKSAVKSGVIREEDLYSQSESSLIAHFEDAAEKSPESNFALLFRTFRRARSVRRSEVPLPGHYSVNVSVKQRYVDPLVETPSGPRRISKILPEAARQIDDLRSFKDLPYACVEYIR